MANNRCMTKKAVNQLIKEMGFTYEQMQVFWDELVNTNKKVSALHSAGINWDQMNESVIRSLPTQRQRDIENTRIQLEQAEHELQEAVKKQAEIDFYNEHFEEIIVSKIDNKQELTEPEIKQLIEAYEITTEEGSLLRWTQEMITIVELNNRNFAIEWQRGLTEYQENVYKLQPYEVKPYACEKVVVVTEWRKVSNEVACSTVKYKEATNA